MAISLKKTTVLLGAAFILSSCTCGVPLKVTPIQRSDKKLTCKEVILEINEAEHYREHGGKAKGIELGEALMPICWATGYIDGNKAANQANERIKYLSHIYDLLDCANEEENQQKGDLVKVTPIVVPAAPAAAPAATPAPTPVKEDFNGSWHYRERGSFGKTILHEHRDSRGKLYIHSHPHDGPHRHIEDEPR